LLQQAFAATPPVCWKGLVGNGQCAGAQHGQVPLLGLASEQRGEEELRNEVL